MKIQYPMRKNSRKTKFFWLFVNDIHRSLLKCILKSCHFNDGQTQSWIIYKSILSNIFKLHSIKTFLAFQFIEHLISMYLNGKQNEKLSSTSSFALKINVKTHEMKNMFFDEKFSSFFTRNTTQWWNNVHNDLHWNWTCYEISDGYILPSVIS